MSRLRQGEVWWAHLDKVRPVVILTRDGVVDLLSEVLVAPVTSVSRGIPTEVWLGDEEGLAPGSIANLDHVRALSVRRLRDRAGQLSPDRWPEVCDAMAHAIGCGR